MTDEPWPQPIGQAAYRGLAGRVVRAIAPESEASPELLLLGFLIAFGNWIGRGAYHKVESTKHYTNEFAVFVGPTSMGRKGTGWDRIRDLFNEADALGGPWIARIKSGLSSGEGLITQVTGDEKRLMVVEPEFARSLIVINREGSVLSALLRSAWESGDLRIMKLNPVEASEAHISMIGHITTDELKANLDRVEVANGFANRILFALVRRSKELPFGGADVDYAPLARKLRAVKRKTANVGRVTWGKGSAARLWAAEYKRLTEGRPGMIGSVTSRGAPHVLRLAMIYALLDETNEIRLPHLESALEVWRYCEDSAVIIFGESSGNRVADTILAAVRKQPLSRTDIVSTVFRRNIGADRITEALDLLEGDGKIRRQKMTTRGRPSEVWEAVNS